MSGLWHIDPGVAHYARQQTETYATGARTTGSLTSPAFSLVGSGNFLVIRTREEVEPDPASSNPSNCNSAAGRPVCSSEEGREIRRIQVSTDNGAKWQLVAESRLFQLTSYRRVTLGLDAFSPAKQARLRFTFDSRDGQDNNRYGWGLDSVTVIRTPVPIEFTAVPGAAAANGPVATLSTAGGATVASVDASGHLQILDVAADGTIGAPSLLSPGGLDVLATPALLRVAGLEYVYARRTDGRIYEASRLPNTSFGTLTAVSGVSNATSRFAVGKTPTADGPEQRVLVWVGTDSHVYSTLGPGKSRLLAADLTELLKLAPAAAGKPAFTEGYVAVPTGSSIAVARLTAAGATLVRTVDAPLGATMAFYGGTVHVGHTSGRRFHDLMFVPAAKPKAADVVVSALEGKQPAVTTLPELTVHRGHLYASWLEGTAPRVARWDSADGSTSARWVTEYTGRGVVSSAPAVVAVGGGADVYVSTSLGRIARYRTSGGWSDLGLLRLGSQTVRPVERPTALASGNSSEAFYTLDDGRTARVRGDDYEVLPRGPTLYGAESGPTAVRYSAGGSQRTLLAYEAGDRIGQTVLRATGGPSVAVLALGGGAKATSPLTALPGGSDGALYRLFVRVGADRVKMITARPPVGAAVGERDLGTLPGSTNVVSAPAALDRASNRTLVVVVGADGKLYLNRVRRSDESGFKIVDGDYGTVQGQVALAARGSQEILAVLGRDGRLRLGNLQPNAVGGPRLASVQLSPTGLRFQFGPSLAVVGDTPRVFATTLDGVLVEGVRSGGSYSFSSRGVPPTPGAPTLPRPIALASTGVRLLGFRSGKGTGLQVLDVKAAGLHERLAAIGFTVVWHSLMPYPQPETALDQTWVWNESAHVAERLPEPLGRRYLRLGLRSIPFDSGRTLVTPVNRDPPYIGARPFGNIVVEDNDDEFRQWEENGHALASAFGVAPGDPVLDPVLAFKNPSVITQMRTLFGRANCSVVSASGVGAYGRSPSGRDRGFTGIRGGYECFGEQHSFMYPLIQYGSNGTQFRADAAEDAAAGVPLLQQKYNWLKTYVFGGREFRTGQEPCPSTGC